MTDQVQPPVLRVMIVEDHALVRDAIRRTLSVPGIDVVAVVASAEEALATAAAHRPDVMLATAIELPGMNGIQLVRELAPRLPDTHMVMLTGSANRDDLVLAIRNGAAGYLTKDMPPQGLVRAVLGVRDGDLPMPRHLARQLVRELVSGPARRTNTTGLSAR